MFTCKICNKKFEKALSLNAHLSCHSTKIEKRKIDKNKMYTNHIDVKPDIFLDNKYTKIYYSIISQARKKNYTGYIEKHHIIPKCLGGSNEFTNLIRLTSREHFLCHYLLTKMIDKHETSYNKIIHAFIMMKSSSRFHKRYFNSRLYTNAKKIISSLKKRDMVGNNNPSSGSIWIFNFLKKENKKLKKIN